MTKYKISPRWNKLHTTISHSTKRTK